MALKVKERDGRLHISGTVEGVRVRKSTGLPPADKVAAQFIKASVEAALLAPKARKGVPSVRAACMRYLRRPEGVGNTTGLYVERFIASFGDRALDELDAWEVYEWVVEEGGEKKPATLRRELGAIEAAVAWAAKAFGIKVEFQLQKPETGEARLRFLELAEMKAVIQAAPAWFRPLVTVLFYTGIRRGEAAKLRWTDVRYNGKGEMDGIVVSTRKGRSRKVRHRFIPLHAEAKAALETARARSKKGEEFVFVDHGGNPWGKDVSRISKWWRATAKKAGVEDCNAHDARRTFASMLLKNGVDLRTIAELLGHTSLAMLSVYAQVTGAQKAGSVGLLPMLDGAGEED